jgi:hypothetical protein
MKKIINKRRRRKHPKGEPPLEGDPPFGWYTPKKRATPEKCSSFENPAVKIIVPAMLQ